MSSVSSAPKLAGMDYRVIRPLGTGAGSTILLIADPSGAKYALKVVKRQGPEDDIYVNQALHEFDVAQKLNHANILKIHDRAVQRKWFRNAGVELLMEYVDGKTLDEVDPPKLPQLVLIFWRVASALAHMHRRGVYHGDLKPMNIMLSRAGEVKVLDFGTAWVKGEDKARVQGTPQYMAPEQATDKVVDERTDLYNFGATMYRLLTGEYANLGLEVMANGLAAAFAAKRKPPMEFNPEIPGTLNELVMACLQPDPDRRPAGAFEVKHQIKAAARYLGVGKADLLGADEQGDD